MRLIDADALERELVRYNSTPGGYLTRIEVKRIENLICEWPTVDAVPVVRCKDCKQWDEEGSYMGRGWCGYQMKSTGPRYFCADGEVEEGEEDDETGDH